MRVSPGDTAWVQRGPFAGFLATIIQLDANGTAHVDLDVFGRSTPAEVSVDLLDLFPPGSGAAGVREPRRPLSPMDSAATSATPSPE
jgi:hypothetical protein